MTATTTTPEAATTTSTTLATPSSASSLLPNRLAPSSSQEVRAKFFNVIGISDDRRSAIPAPSNGTEGSSNPTPSTGGMVSTGWVHPRSQQVAKLQEMLKYDKDADRLYLPKKRKTDEEGESPKKSRKQLSFHDTVDIVPIPMRTEYSNRVRDRLWSSAVEIQENASRNTVEYAYEGWKCENVYEEPNFYVSVATGELIHPCHYDNLQNPEAGTDS